MIETQAVYNKGGGGDRPRRQARQRKTIVLQRFYEIFE